MYTKMGKKEHRGFKKAISLMLILAMISSFLCFNSSGVEAKGELAAGDCVKNVLLYARNSKGEDVLVSKMNVQDMLNYLNNNFQTYGKVHNYSILDRLVTPVHQEAQGFTVPQMLEYAKTKSTLSNVNNLGLGFSGNDAMAFWSLDGDGFSDMNTFTYNTMYNVPRYNFPALYEQWDYNKMKYLDKDTIWNSRQSEQVLLSITAFSQRYCITNEKVDNKDYNMENYFDSENKLDTEKTVRLMLPMTKDDFDNQVSTANDSRWGICYMLLNMENHPVIDAGKVDKPTCTVIDGDTDKSGQYEAGYSYFTLNCKTEGATILYNDNSEGSYVPTAEYKSGQQIKVKKTSAGLAQLKVRAVKEGCTDEGVQTLDNQSNGDDDNGEVVNPSANVWDGTTSTPVNEVNGVYTINTSSELKWISDQVNSGNDFSGKTVELNNDLHLDKHPWKVIGDLTGDTYDAKGGGIQYTGKCYYFSGTFDGKGHTISGLNPVTLVDIAPRMERDGRTGLFGGVKNAVIKNLTVSGVIKTATIQGVGGIAGAAASTQFINCTNKVNFKIPSDAVGGGILGISDYYVSSTTPCAIENCTNDGNIEVDEGNVGGIVGSGQIIVKGCVNNGKVKTNTNDSSAQGIGSASKIQNCINNGDISSTNEQGAEGIGESGEIENCINNGHVIGGCGIGGGKISKCINTGDATLAGISNSGDITECVNTASSKYGLMSNGNMENSYNIGAVSLAGLTGAPGSMQNIYDVSGGAALGSDANVASANISNVYFMDKGSEVAGDPTIDIRGIDSKTADYMKSDAFVSLLNKNAGDTIFAKDAAGINNGYPKFTWETGIAYNTNGGNTIKAQRMMPGTVATKPDDPVKEGYIFTGWYTDAALATAYDFSKPVNQDIVVYAGWKERAKAYPVAKQVILSWTGKTDTSQSVIWCDNSGNTEYVQYVPESSYKDETSFSSSNQVIATSKSVGYDSDAKIYYNATMTGLTPGTKYYYRVGNDGNWSDVSTFTTSPSSTQNYSFMYMGDVQHVTTAEKEYPIWGSLLNGAYAANPNIAFGLMGGDMVESGSDMKDWTYLLSYASDVFSKIPMMTTIGNHESNFQGGKAEFYKDILALPNNGPSGFEKEFYSFDYGTTHVTVLNSWALSSEQNLTDEQNTEISNWIKNDLASASKAKFRIVVQHHPAYALEPDTVCAAVLAKWVPLFEAGNVDMVLCGHQHAYSRSYPMYAGKIDNAKGITYVMGNAGQKFYTNADTTYSAKTILSKSTYEIVNVNNNTLSLCAYDSDGKLLDSFSTTSKTTAQSITGDVNDDGVVDMSDVNAVYKAVLNCDDYNSKMDINNDGVVDMRDVQLLLKISLKKAS